MSLLTREQILAAQDRRYTELPVPEWGGTLRLRSSTAGERAELAKVAAGLDKDGDGLAFKTAAVANAICDAAGERVLTAADVDALGAKSATVLDRVFGAVLALNKVDPAQQEARAKN